MSLIDDEASKVGHPEAHKREKAEATSVKNRKQQS